MDHIPDNNEFPPKIPSPVQPLATAILEEEATTIAMGDLISGSQPLAAALPTTTNGSENLVYFSDGTATQSELSMSPEQTASTSTDEQQVALPDGLIEVYRNLGILGKILNGGSLVTLRVLQVFGSFGESVIDMLGITRPKYEYEINYAKEMQQREQERNDKVENLYSTWQPSAQVPSVPPQSFPPPIPVNHTPAPVPSAAPQNLPSTPITPPVVEPAILPQQPQYVPPTVEPQLPSMPEPVVPLSPSSFAPEEPAISPQSFALPENDQPSPVAEIPSVTSPAEPEELSMR